MSFPLATVAAVLPAGALAAAPIAGLDVVDGRTLRMSVAIGPREFPLVLARDGIRWRTA